MSTYRHAKVRSGVQADLPDLVTSILGTGGLTWMISTPAIWFIAGFAVFRVGERIAQRRRSLSSY